MARSVNVWAAGCGVRVDPLTGRYIEDRRDIRRDYPSGDYRARNAAWDATRNRVTLFAARNEFAAFQVVLEADQPTGRVEVRLNKLIGPGGAQIAGRNVALFKAWYVKVNQPSTGYDRLSLGPAWYPDALLPAAPGGALALTIPDETNDVPGQRNQSVWVDVFVPRDRQEAPPGVYRGELAVVWRGGRRRVAVELHVWGFALPDEIHLRGDIWNDSIRTMPPERELGYYQLARQHRFAPGVYGYRPRLSIRRGRVRLDWTEYDARLRKYLDGSAFTERAGYWGPGAGLPLDHLLMPFNCERGEDASKAWPMATPAGGPTPEFEAVWTEAARQVREHFDADPAWRRVAKIVFLNGLDESYNDAAYAKMIYFCKLLRTALGEDWFRYRIDGGYSWKAMDRLAGCVDLWVCHTIGFDASKMEHFRRRGVDGWFYGPMIYERRTNDQCGSNTFLDLDLLTCRGVGWAAWRHRSGFCEWEFDAMADRIADIRDPDRNWAEALNYRTKINAFNGSGLLIYRGAPVGSASPIPSIRLKAHRRGFQDYEYFWLLANAGRGRDADKLVNSVVRRTPFGRASVGKVDIWRNDPEAWEAARLRAGEALHQLASRQRTRWAMKQGPGVNAIGGL